jgi:hypothetical protein
MKLFGEQREQVAAAAMLGLWLVLASAIGSYAFYRVHTLNNTLTVTGSTIENAIADAAKWTVGVSRTADESNLGIVQARVANDAKTVVDYFSKAGIPAKDITTSIVFVDQRYSNDTNAPLQYNVHEEVTVQADDPHMIEKLSKNISILYNKGVVVYPSAPEYYVTTLPSIRIALIGRAIADAKARATEIAKTTDQAVGPLQSASGGVVQVTAPNSVGDVSDYGSYDTSTIEKQVMVTARATFYIR